MEAAARRTAPLALALLLALIAVAPVRAQSGAVVSALSDRTVIDWSQGLIIADGAAPADMRAPTVGIARTKAMRASRDDARDRLIKALPLVPVVGDAITAEQARSLVEHAVVLEEQLGSDGSSVIRLALGLDQIRRSLFGAQRVSKTQPDALVVELGPQNMTPTVGLELRAGAERYRGPVVFTRSSVARAAPRGAKSERLKAIAVSDGGVEIGDAAAPVLVRARESEALVVVVLPPKEDGKKRGASKR